VVTFPRSLPERKQSGGRNGEDSQEAAEFGIGLKASTRQHLI
jgi:hypothetical protein